MLNQRWFNGMGNYLRAEILHRAGIHPFTRAHHVLEPALKAKLGREEVIGGDLLSLCRTVMLESLDILRASGFSRDSTSDESAFGRWLQCYTKGNANAQDGLGRRIW